MKHQAEERVRILEEELAVAINELNGLCRQIQHLLHGTFSLATPKECIDDLKEYMEKQFNE